MRLILALLVFSASPAFATMYFAAYDPATGEIGLAYSSSGGHFWQTLVKDKGLAGAQNYGLCDEATPQEFLEQGLSAGEVARRVKEQCDAADYHSYRFLVVTADGKIDYVIGRDGCSIPDCGARRGANVVVTGGGLEEGVLDAAIQAYESLDLNLSFTCRLFNTLKQVYAAGGEFHEFQGASLTVNSPKEGRFQHFQSDIFGGGGQQDLLTDLGRQLKAQGHACSN
jgi:uncharacterized Ntn-hydrolase superfamily protein